MRRYLSVLRRRRVVIVGVALVAVAVALALSLTKDKTYSAEGSARVKDPSELLGIAGLLPTQGELPAQTSAQTADTATSSAVLKRVASELSIKQTVDQLRSRISATQDAQSNLVQVSATGPTGKSAADLANATLEELARATDRKQQKRYAHLADRLREKIKQLQDQAPNAAAVLTPKEQAQAADSLQERRTLSETAARLETLSNATGIVEITERADVPSSPSSPKPLLSAIVGAIVGLIIGVIIAAVMEVLDRRLRSADEVQALLELPLAGVVAEQSMGMVPIGAEALEDKVAGMDSFRMLRTNVRFLEGESPIKTILVTSPLPEEGKTTVAIGMAAASASAGQRTLLIEADLHRPVHSQRLGIPRSPGLVDFLRGSASPREVLRSVDFVDPEITQRLGGANGDGTNGDGGAAERPAEADESRLACIPAGDLAGMSSEILGSKAFGKFLSQVQRVYDVIVIDTAPLLAVAETSELVELCDAVVLCVRVDKTTAEQAKAGRDALSRLPDRPTGVAITGFRPTASDAYSYYNYSYNYRFGDEGGSRSLFRRRKRDGGDSSEAGEPAVTASDSDADREN